VKRDEHMKSYSAAELAEMRARGQSRTDWARVRAKTEEELERDIASDPDWTDIPPDWCDHAQAVVPGKTLVSVPLDADLVDWFKARGPGYLTRIDAALRQYMRQRKDRRRAG
jgi:uncharacterized protein (DUF4415 family)